MVVTKTQASDQAAATDKVKPALQQRSTKRMRFSAQASGIAVDKKRLRLPTKSQAFLLVRRFLGLVAAMYCIYASVSSGLYSLRTLYGSSISSTAYNSYRSKHIQSYLGSSRTNQSRLVREVLRGDTSPRAYTVYIESETSYTTTGCQKVAKFNSILYGDTFLRSNLQDIVAKTAYNLTFLADMELITPIVDCSFTPIQVGDSTAARVFYLMRQIRSPTHVSVLMVSLSTQDYDLPEYHQSGSTALVVITELGDMRDAFVNHYVALALAYPFEGPNYQVYTFLDVTKEGFVQLESVPIDITKERKKRVLTANRSGFYVKSEESQSNIKNLYWKLSQNPLEAVAKWEWVGTTVLRNAWGWTRYVDFFFSAQTSFNIMVLLLVIYRNYQQGKIWIGDAFISFSDTLLLRGASVIAIWLMEGFWTLLTFALSDGNTVGDGIGVFSFTQIIHGDLLTVYISLAGLLGYILRERINPALVVVLFQVGFNLRLTILEWFPGIMAVVVDYSQEDYLSGMAELPAELAGFSPFLFWSIHPLAGQAHAAFAALFPVFSTFAVLLIYAPLRKVWRWYLAHRRNRYRSDEASAVTTKSSLTVFELATGAELQNRVGLVSDYESCVYIKGLKFASADGIYCNGFIIVNNKWLIRTRDLLSIGLMVLSGLRFRDVYVYEVKEHTVNQTAQLVYPNMMTPSDLLQLNTKLLA